MRIAVVTPLFPSSVNPLRGTYIYNTVLSLQGLADVQVFCVNMKYPARFFGRRRVRRSAALHSGQRPCEVPAEVPGVIQVRHLDYPGIPWLTRALNSRMCRFILQPQLKSFAPDLILAYWTHPSGHAAIAAGEALGVPVVVGALGSDLLLSKGIGRRFARRAVTKARRVLTVSEHLRRAAISLGAQPPRVTTIRNGCDRSIFSPRNRPESRARLGIARSTRLVLFVGWLAPLKGLPELVAAFAEVRRKIPGAELVCIGDGPLKNWLSSLPPESGVRAVGPKTNGEIADWLGACDLLCLPSYSEGCPNVVVEALSSGRPIVATAVGGIPELVDENSGILVAPHDWSQLAAAISGALTRPWNETAIAARHSRSWEDVARETHDACREVLTERKSRVQETPVYATR